MAPTLISSCLRLPTAVKVIFKIEIFKLEKAALLGFRIIRFTTHYGRLNAPQLSASFSVIDQSAHRIRGNRTPAFYLFLRVLGWSTTHFVQFYHYGQKMAFYLKWRSNRKWRSITADTVLVLSDSLTDNKQWMLIGPF